MSSIERILITGGTGFIGHHAAWSLMEKGYDVVVATRNSASGKNNTYEVNLLDYSSVRKMMIDVRPSHLLHLAWDVEEGYLDRAENMDWVIASLELLKVFSLSGGKRAVFAGTCFEYDLNYGYLSEALTPLEPASFYGHAKADLYRIAVNYALNRDLSFAWGRIFYIYGEYEKKNRLLPDVIRSILQGKQPVIKTPTLCRDYMYSGDTAGAFVALLESEVQGAVNIATGKSVSIGDLVASVAKILDFRLDDRVNTSPGSPANALILGDITRLSNELRWFPSYTLEMGLEKTVSWWKERGSFW